MKLILVMLAVIVGILMLSYTPAHGLITSISLFIG